MDLLGQRANRTRRHTWHGSAWMRALAPTLQSMSPVLFWCIAFGLVYGIMCGNAAGWTSSVVTTALGIGFLFAALFVGWELRI